MGLLKKLTNVMTFGYLLVLDKKVPEDLARVKRIQNKKNSSSYEKSL